MQIHLPIRCQNSNTWLKNNPHILGINEVLPKNFSRNINVEEFNLDGYEMIAHPNVPNNKGRGSLLYIRNDIKYNQQFFSEGNDIFDYSIYIEIKLNGQDKLLCSCMYRRGESSEQNNENLLNNLNHISKLKYSHLLIMGTLIWHKLTGKIVLVETRTQITRTTNSQNASKTATYTNTQMNQQDKEVQTPLAHSISF